jgi:hypothetical protein
VSVNPNPESTLVARFGVPAVRVRCTTVDPGRVPAGTRATMRGAPTTPARGAVVTTRPAGLATTVPDMPMPIPAWCCAFTTTGRTNAKLATIQIRRIVHLPGDPTSLLQLNYPNYNPIIPRLLIHPTLKRCADRHQGFMLAHPRQARPLLLHLPARPAAQPTDRFSLTIGCAITVGPWNAP